MTVHIHIIGKVQGVFFRASAKEKADAFRLKGWIKNIPDGSVQIVVTGEESSVKEFIAWCKKGPKGARVSEVLVTEEPEEIKFERFVIAN